MFHRDSRLRLLALWLALSGVLLRGLVPTGFMPGWTQAGDDGSRSWLTICPAGELQALLPQSPHAHHHHHHPGMVMAVGAADSGVDHSAHRIGEAHLGCPFAAAATPTLPLSLAALSLPEGALQFTGAAAPIRVGIPAARRLPPARAPPAGRVI